MGIVANMEDAVRESLAIIIERYNGHFSFTEDGTRLFDRFCGRTVSQQDMKSIDKHVNSQEHQTNMSNFSIRQKIEKTLKSKGQRKSQIDENFIDKLTANLNKTADEMEIDNVDQLDDDFISSFVEDSRTAQSKLSKVEHVHKALKHRIIGDAEGSFVKCNICDVNLNDQFSSIATHLISREHHKAVSTKAGENEKKVTSGVVDFVSQSEYLFIRNGTVKCLPCGTEFEDSKLCNIKEHMGTEKHRQGVQLYNRRIEREQRVSEKDFNSWLLLTMASNDIPLHKVIGLKDFLEGFIGRRIISETTLREHLGEARQLVQNEVRRQIGDKNIFISMDEATNTRQTTRFVTTIIGTLDPENPTEQKVFVWKFSEVKGSWDTNAVINLFNEVVHEVYGKKWLALARDRVKLFITDGGSQMVAGAKILTQKANYPDMTFFTCLCHAVNNLCETICDNFKVAVSFVSAMNYILYCSPKRMDTFRSLADFKRVPPKIVPTRWGSGLRAISYWHSNFELAKSFLSTLDRKGKDAQVVTKARKLREDPELVPSLETVAVNFAPIADIITKLETRNLPLSESFRLVDNVKARLDEFSKVNSQIGQTLVDRMNGILGNNPGFSQLKENIDQIDTDEKIRCLKFAPGGSFDTERGNKIFKHTLTDDRSRLTFENADNWSYIKFNCVNLNFKETVKSRQERERLQYSSQRSGFGQLFGFLPEFNMITDNEIDIPTSLNDTCHTSDVNEEEFCDEFDDYFDVNFD